MKTTASIFKIHGNGQANGNTVTFRDPPIEMPSRHNQDLHRAWSLEALPPPGMVMSRPLKKKGLFGAGSSMEGSWQVLATQTLKIASINGLGDVDKIENDLEDELSYENRSPAKTAFGRLRREGHHQLHSKGVLFVVVLLNIIDTVFVMVGLILDFHHVSMLLEAKLDMLDSFANNLRQKYTLNNTGPEVLQNLLDAHIIFNMSAMIPNVTDVAAECVSFLNKTAATSNSTFSSYINSLPAGDNDFSEPGACFKAYMPSNVSYNLSSNGNVDETLSEVAHKLHYCSLTILAILVIILLLKLVCTGARFFRDHMQVFDGLITVISFILDIVFINGVTFFNQEQFVVILTLLFPWRVIRILNSLIAAVLDKHKLNLKIIYTQKKKIAKQLQETNSKVELLQRHIEILQGLCSSRGIGELEVSRALGADALGGPQKNGAGGGLAGMMALSKLAFQAADAFAPLSNGYKKDKDEGSSPQSSSSSGADSQASSPSKSNTTDTTFIGDSNNAISKPRNGQLRKDTSITLPSSGSYPDTLTTASIDEVVTVHINGSGPPRTRGNSQQKKNKKLSRSLPDLTEDDKGDDSDLISRL